MAAINVVVILFVMTSLCPMTSSAAKNVAQVRVFVEWSAMEKWMKQTEKSGEKEFRRTMDATFFEINEVFKTMKDNGVDVQLQIDDLIFFKNNILNTNNGRVGTSDALSQFGKRVKQTYNKSPYDLAILFTGSELIGAYGYASLGGVCSEGALGVVQYDETYMNALLTAHEIGHIFGSPHDGQDDSYSCRSDSGEVMNPVVQPHKPRHFYFSSCTAAAFKKTIADLDKAGTNCMLKWDKSEDIKGPRMGQIMTADAVCRQGQGKDTYVARNYLKEDKMCLYLPCMTDIQGQAMMFQSTPQGMNCGMNKQCIQGKCIKTSDGSAAVSDTCPFGDQPELLDGKTCATVTGSDCSRDRYKKECCESCNDPGTPDEVCKRLVDDSSALGRAYYASYGDEVCSKLRCLNDLDNGYFTATTFKAPNGMKCGKSKVCEDGKCVKSKLGDAKMSDTCPFGDQPWLGGLFKSNCFDYVKKNGCKIQKRMKHMCCSSCSETETADDICRKEYGSDSALARLEYRGDYSSICSSLKCLTAVTNNFASYSWFTMEAPDGMKCGKEKRCYKSQCVATKAGDPNVSDSCPFGDQPVQNGVWSYDCRDLTDQCSWRGDICCGTCANNAG